MKNRIDSMFSAARKRKEAALIPFVTTGFPDVEFTEALIREMAGRGADLVEIGMPFSDPVADGPTIEAASHAALEKNSISPPDLFDMVARLRRDISIPIVIMGYYNQFFRYGLDAFAGDAAGAGVDGTIIPDLPVDEAADWMAAASKAGIHNIFLVAPNTPEKRIVRIARATRGFLYHVSVMGITGARTELPPELSQGLERVKERCRKPVAVGFGISRPEQVSMLSGHADGIIVGSAIIRLIQQGLQDDVANAEKRAGTVKRIGEFVESLKHATRKTG
jgi:tryptophan synthase alpha chain